MAARKHNFTRKNVPLRYKHLFQYVSSLSTSNKISAPASPLRIEFHDEKHCKWRKVEGIADINNSADFVDNSEEHEAAVSLSWIRFYDLLHAIIIA